MKWLISYFKNDYNNVKWCLQNQFKVKWSNAAVFIYYWGFVILFFPIVMLVLLATKIWIWNLKRQINKLEKDIEGRA